MNPIYMLGLLVLGVVVALMAAHAATKIVYLPLKNDAWSKRVVTQCEAIGGGVEEHPVTLILPCYGKERETMRIVETAVRSATCPLRVSILVVLSGVVAEVAYDVATLLYREGWFQGTGEWLTLSKMITTVYGGPVPLSTYAVYGEAMKHLHHGPPTAEGAVPPVYVFTSVATELVDGWDERAVEGVKSTSGNAVLSYCVPKRVESPTCACVAFAPRKQSLGTGPQSVPRIAWMELQGALEGVSTPLLSRCLHSSLLVMDSVLLGKLDGAERAISSLFSRYPFPPSFFDLLVTARVFEVGGGTFVGTPTSLLVQARSSDALEGLGVLRAYEQVHPEIAAESFERALDTLGRAAAKSEGIFRGIMGIDVLSGRSSMAALMGVLPFNPKLRAQWTEDTLLRYGTFEKYEEEVKAVKARVESDGIKLN